MHLYIDYFTSKLHNSFFYPKQSCQYGRYNHSAECVKTLYILESEICLNAVCQNLSIKMRLS